MGRPDLKISMVDLSYLLSNVAYQHTKRSHIEHALRAYFKDSGASTILIYDADDNTSDANRKLQLGRARIVET